MDRDFVIMRRGRSPSPALPPQTARGKGASPVRFGESGAFPGCPLPPAPSPASGRGGDLNCASAGPALSTTQAVREGGLWALVAATSVAPAGPRPRLP
ncbi:MAG: hypothetical protein AVDCRST_MAG89-3624 [uncultured Gemmatimonadetes bacterium]|uniref:Uncharacterized protein n=1 Tax=uncultured Gemmatimonadota bacterium TaxID=203437 RepID=A0A6J4MJM5_9BACT|nr:MAG: hypothetical protein AVDCRST_MAG89-3624 [uncultured Gemmatimonadota bacterium]